MKKKLIFIILSFFIHNAVFAENFYIENYDVNLNVNKDKSVNITEDIQVNFFKPSHGIYRTIPFKNGIISNVYVNKRHKITNSASAINIKIGDPHTYINGKHDYKISYTYTIKDTNNEFYYNIIGTEWPVPINNATFKVTMPKDFDFSKTGISIGSYGTQGYEKRAVHQKQGLTLSGYTTQKLAPFEGITLRISVPEDYFTNGKKVKLKKKIALAGIILFTLISFIIWFKYGKDEPVIPIVSFYPPEGINSVDAELIFNEKATEKGLIALLIELASKGYVSIEENPNNEENFFINKLKAYDGNNPIEKSFLDAIFFGRANGTTIQNLEASPFFYQNCANIIKMCNKNKSAVFEKDSISIINRSILFICILIIGLLTLYALVGYNFTPFLSPIIIFPITAFLILLFHSKAKEIIAWALIYGGMPTIILITQAGIDTTQYPIVFTGIIGLIISVICCKQLAKKNKLGQKLMSNLLGLKKFIEVAEKHRLNSLVEKNPNYFYNILPYAYILGVSDKWISQLEKIIPKNSEWYRGSRFKKFTKKMHSASIPTTANGGIRSSSSRGGGGRSGGGHGGGGGGSW